MESPATPLQRSLAAARANIVPGLCLQAFALAVVIAYYFHPATHQALDVIAGYKTRLGLLFSLVSTAIFGGLIPFAYMRANPRTREVTPGNQGFFFLLFWGYRGMEVDLFYRLQGRLFGNDPTPLVILKKILVDQLPYNIFWAGPMVLLAFHWKETGFNVRAMRELNWWAFLRGNLPMGMISTWGVWAPAVAIIYSLPAPLQVPLFNIVLCFFSLMMASLTRKRA